MAQTVKNPPAMRETWVWSLGWDNPLEECMATHSSILTWRIPMDRGAWRTTVQGITKSWTRLSNWSNLIFSCSSAHPSIWDPSFCLCIYNKIGFPGGTSSKDPACQGRRCKRQGFDPWVGTIPSRRAWQPTSVSLPGESHRQRRLAGYCLGVPESWMWLKQLSLHAYHKILTVMLAIC